MNPSTGFPLTRICVHKERICMKYNDIFQPEYQFSLETICYQRCTEVLNLSEIKLNISDDLSIAGRNDKEVRFLIKRSICFTPSPLFSLSICFSASTQMKSGIDTNLQDNVLIQTVLEDNMSFLQNLLSRISMLCAEITSSYGLQPFIFPPTFINHPLNNC